MVYYRKYRPQKIAELDNAHIREVLTQVLSSKSVVHALLFTGPKGLGKTSTARIVAKAVNCEKVPQVSKVSQVPRGEKTRDTLAIEPCNKCDQCLSITNGSNIDVLEIDGASNRGIDEIRDLREKIRLAPAKAANKIYIIDEVHMLTTEAFNALLKTLEEPPAHTMFIFCTTEPHKVPATILSRCFHIQFRRATDEELVSSFKRILEGEKLKADDEALVSIAKLSDGSFRDGAKILEEISLASVGKKITKALVEEKYQIVGIDQQISAMIEALAKRDAKAGVLLVAKLVEQGVDAKYFIEKLIAFFHNQLLRNVGIGEEKNTQDKEWKMEDISKIVDYLTKAHAAVKYAVLPQLPLELVIIEYTQNNAKQNTEQREKNIQHGLASSSASVSDKKDQVKQGDSQSAQIFQELIEHVKKQNHSLAGVLRGCKLESFDGKNLTISTTFKFHKEKLDNSTAMELLEKVAQEIAGNPISVKIILKGS